MPNRSRMFTMRSLDSLLLLTTCRPKSSSKKVFLENFRLMVGVLGFANSNLISFILNIFLSTNFWFLNKSIKKPLLMQRKVGIFWIDQKVWGNSHACWWMKPSNRRKYARHAYEMQLRTQCEWEDYTLSRIDLNLEKYLLIQQLMKGRFWSGESPNDSHKRCLTYLKEFEELANYHES